MIILHACNIPSIFEILKRHSNPSPEEKDENAKNGIKLGKKMQMLRYEINNDWLDFTKYKARTKTKRKSQSIDKLTNPYEINWKCQDWHIYK